MSKQKDEIRRFAQEKQQLEVVFTLPALFQSRAVSAGLFVLIPQVE